MDEPPVSGTISGPKDADGDLKELDFDLGPNDEKPKTMEELVQALQESGFFGAWKDCRDIGDTRAFARALRMQAETRAHE